MNAAASGYSPGFATDGNDPQCSTDGTCWITLPCPQGTKGLTMTPGNWALQPKPACTSTTTTVAPTTTNLPTTTTTTRSPCDRSAAWDVGCTEGVFELSIDRVTPATITSGPSIGMGVQVTGILNISGVPTNVSDMNTFPKISGNYTAWMFFVPKDNALNLFQIILEKGVNTVNGNDNVDFKGGGAAISVYGHAVLRKCLIRDNVNTAGNGAALFVTGHAVVMNSVMTNNPSNGNGGVGYLAGQNSFLDIIDSTTSDDFFFDNGGTLRMKNSVVYGRPWGLYTPQSLVELQLDHVELEDADPFAYFKNKVCIDTLSHCMFPGTMKWFKSTDCNSTVCPHKTTTTTSAPTKSTTTLASTSTTTLALTTTTTTLFSTTTTTSAASTITTTTLVPTTTIAYAPTTTTFVRPAIVPSRWSKCPVGSGGQDCRGCLKGYFRYPTGFNICHRCGKQVFKTIVSPIETLSIITVSLFAVVVAIVYCAEKKHGGTLLGGLGRAASFVVYFCISVSLVAQVSRACLGKLPDYLNNLASYLIAFQFDFSSIISPQCLASPYWKELSIATTSIALVALHATASFGSRWNSLQSSKFLKYTRHVLALVLWILYPKAIHYCLATIHCVPNEHEGGVYILYDNNLAQCFVGDHTIAFVLCSLALLIHGLLFPLVTFFSVRNIVQSEPDIEDPRKMKYFAAWNFFLYQDYKPRFFWFRHVELIVMTVVEVLNQFLSRQNAYAYWVCSSSTFILVFVLFACSSPFSTSFAWKFPVRLYLIACTLLYATTNYCSTSASFGGEGRAQLVWLAPLTMGATMALFLLLSVSFGLTLIHGATKEQEEIEYENAVVIRRRFGNLDDVMNVALIREHKREETMFSEPARAPFAWNPFHHLFQKLEQKMVELREFKFVGNKGGGDYYSHDS